MVGETLLLLQVSTIATQGAALRGMSLQLCRGGSSFNFFCSLGLESGVDSCRGGSNTVTQHFACSEHFAGIN